MDIFWKTLVESDVSPLTAEERKEMKKGKDEFEKGKTVNYVNLPKYFVRRVGWC